MCLKEILKSELGNSLVVEAIDLEFASVDDLSDMVIVDNSLLVGSVIVVNLVSDCVHKVLKKQQGWGDLSGNISGG